MKRAKALDHVVLVVNDVETTMAWYQRHLGLEGVRIDEWRNKSAPFPSLRITDDTIIDLIPGHDGHRGHIDHLCFVVSAPDLAAMRADPELTVIEEGKRFGAQGVADSIYVTDPDGLTVEFRSYESSAGSP